MTTQTPIAVTGCQTPSPAFVELAAAHGLTLSGDAVLYDRDAETAVIHIANPADAETIRTALSPPYRGFIQAGPEGIPAALIPSLRDTVEAQGLFVSVTTRCAYDCDFAAALLTGVTAWGALRPERAKSVELAVHEALANAILHGNLDVDNGLRSSLDGLAAYARQLTERLTDPAYAGRRITVKMTWNETTLTIAVTDSGAGYENAVATPATAKTGRGLSLIEDSALSVDFADGGRTVVMRFER